VSPNPGGRVGVPPEIRQAAREHTQAAIDALVGCLTSKKENIRILAAEALLNRAWGKPTEHVQTEVTVGGTMDYSKLSDEEVHALEAIVAKAAITSPGKETERKALEAADEKELNSEIQDAEVIEKKEEIEITKTEDSSSKLP